MVRTTLAVASLFVALASAPSSFAFEVQTGGVPLAAMVASRVGAAPSGHPAGTAGPFPPWMNTGRSAADLTGGLPGQGFGRNPPLRAAGQATTAASGSNRAALNEQLFGIRR